MLENHCLGLVLSSEGFFPVEVAVLGLADAFIRMEKRRFILRLYVERYSGYLSVCHLAPAAWLPDGQRQVPRGMDSRKCTVADIQHLLGHQRTTTTDTYLKSFMPNIDSWGACWMRRRQLPCSKGPPLDLSKNSRQLHIPV